MQEVTFSCLHFSPEDVSDLVLRNVRSLLTNLRALASYVQFVYMQRNVWLSPCVSRLHALPRISAAVSVQALNEASGFTLSSSILMGQWITTNEIPNAVGYE
jgi:hypothetical protein